MNKKPHRKKPSKEIKPRFLIVTEGESEENYFIALKKLYRNCPIEIIARKGKQSNPLAVLKTAAKEIADSRDNQYNAAFVVVDREAPSTDPTCLQSALEQSRKPVAKKDIKCDVLISNPSFEVWLLAHFTYTTRSYNNADAVILDLKNYIPNYKKAYDFSSYINDANRGLCIEKLKTALENSKRLERYHGESFSPLRSNPSTQVYKIIESIQICRTQTP